MIYSATDSKKIWFTSDYHFDHKNILKFCPNRKFSSVEEMNRAIIDNHNELVGENDTVIFQGDFCFGNIDQWRQHRSQLNGDFILIRGNHDKFQHNQMRDMFNGIYDRLEVKIKDEELKDGWQNIICDHYALRVWDRSHHGTWHTYAHSHGSLPDDPNSLSCDIGVDCWDMKPVSYEQLKNCMKNKTFKPIDHHR